MRSMEQINEQIQVYQNKLTDLLLEKKLQEKNGYLDPELEASLYLLVDRLETLFWVLEVELKDGNVLHPLSSYYN